MRNSKLLLFQASKFWGGFSIQKYITEAEKSPSRKTHEKLCY
jgi:hypothetical protein